MENRTYKYFGGEPLYPFGHGLSYTEFTYSGLDVAQSYTPGEDMTASVEVTNSGDMDGREVVQFYLTRSERANRSVPKVELVGFDVVDLAPGETATVNVTIPASQIGYYDDAGELTFPEAGTFTLSAGGGQPGYAEGIATAEVSVGE